MALGEHEEQILAEMERHLYEADPDLVARVTTGKTPTGDSPSATETDFPPSPKLSPRNLAIGTVMLVLGLALTLGGVTIGFHILGILLGIVGFLVMVAGVILGARKKQVPAKSAPTAKQTRRK